MANPQPTDAHLRIAHSINEAIMLRDFTKRQRKILDLILRLSWGCNKKHATIPRKRDFQVIGIAETHIKIELEWLQQSKIIYVDGDHYSFNKDFDQWQVSRVYPFTPDKLTELVRLNLQETYQNGKSETAELTKTVSENLPKREVLTYQNSNFSTSKLATPKESIKESNNNNSSSIEINNAYEVYQRNIGELSEIMEKEIALAVKMFTEPWVCDAINVAVKANKKNWVYIAGILKNWQRYGKDAEGKKKDQDPDKYIKGKFGHMVRR